MMKLFLPHVLLVCLCLLPATVGGAEFDVDAGRTILRRLQYCSDCGAALLVTSVHPGAMVRCPDCGREQPRLDNRYLLTQVYQICRICMGPLVSHDHEAGDIVECPICRTRQALVRDAFPPAGAAAGLGYMPGFPPGSGKKHLLYSLNDADAPLSPVPLPEPTSNLPLPGEDIAMRLVPRPPEKPEPATTTSASPPAVPIPELSPVTTAAAATVATPTEVTVSDRGGEAVDTAVAVPAVTVDLFGGGRSGKPGAGGEFKPSGKTLARVDGEPVYAVEVDRVVEPVMRRLRENADAKTLEELTAREKELRREVLDRLVDRQLAVAEAAAIGHRPDPAAIRERERELAPILAGTGMDIRREAERDVVMADMRRRFAEKPGAASPEAIREFYRQNKDQMERPRLVALDQLVVYQYRAGRSDPRDYRDIALEISQALEAGARFDELRAKYDEFLPGAGVPRSQPTLQPEGAYAASVLVAAGDLRKGAVFGPLFLEGMALFGKVADERPAGPIPFEEVEKEIRRRLESEAAEKSLDAWLERLRHKARVEIYQD